jgi:biopolymer transport protein ExbD
LAALAVAIAITLREDVGLRWFGPDFIAPGAELPEAKLGERPPAAPVIHVSNEWVKVRAKRVASADEAISDPDLVVDGLFEEILSVAEELGLRNAYRVITVDADGRIIPTYGPEDDLIIQVDRDVECELLVRVLYTCGRAEYGRLNLAAINPETRALEVFSLELPYAAPEPPRAAAQPEFVLLVGDNWLRLIYNDASGAAVFRNTFEKEYSFLAEELKRIKRRYPEQKRLKITCDRHVKYEELVHIIEVSVQPEIALTEIYITGFKELEK